MFSLTKQERLVLFLLGLIVFFGSLLQFSLKKIPSLNHLTHFLEDEERFYMTDINRASLEELVKIPYIGQFTAQRIIDFRQENGKYVSVDQILLIPGIPGKNYTKFSKYLKVLGP